MKKIYIPIFILIILLTGFFFYNKGKSDNQSSEQTPKGDMQIRSAVFEDGGIIPEKFTCDGDNVSPPLEISNVPKDAVTLMLLVIDLDAPDNLNHWTIWDIAPNETIRVDEGKSPFGGVESANSFAKIGYSGPCPPGGTTHRYSFQVYVLDEEFAKKTKGASPIDQIGAIINKNPKYKAEIIGKYTKKLGSVS